MEEKLLTALESLVLEIENYWDVEGVRDKYSETDLPEATEFHKSMDNAKKLIEDIKGVQ